MKKSTLCFRAIVLATGLCAAPLGFAAPEETVASTAEQPSAADTVQAVHTAEFTDAQGNSVKVVTFSDGSVAASVNGAPLVMGAEAMQTLAAHGISISVAPTGEITGVTTAAGTAVTQAAHAVTAAEAKTAAESVQAAAQDEATTQAPAQAPASVLSVLPANVATGSGLQAQQQTAETQPSTPATGTPNSK